MSLSVIILAAGRGSRMKSTNPKVLHAISGFSMLYYSIKEAKKISDDISVVLFFQANRVKEEISRHFKDINFCIQDHKNYPGTGGAVRGVDTKYNKILVLNGDMPLVEAEELKKFTKIDSDIVMSVIDMQDPSGYGRVVIKEDEVIKVVEQKDATSQELKISSVNAGVYLFRKDILNTYLPKLSNSNAQQEYYITDLIELSRQDGFKVSPLFVKEENFKGVNSKKDLSESESIMQRRIKNRFMESGVVFKMPDSSYIESEVEIEGESVIESGVSLIGRSKIINSIVKTNSIVEDSTLKDSSVGPLARIRPNSTLTNTTIGNFVEVKNSTLDGVKAGHLSYIGDSTIQSGTNIGAGVITCNYDGKDKHQTYIGKDVFIGSDTQLVAPLKIEDRVIIGAGTTVTKDIPTGSLAISRTPLKIVRDFFRKFFS
jgi:bifunctional UDP-N-acetylglucosamine pyrophosphorylase/glucosamine-1-phosphate N-acetyltransferase